MEKIQYIGDDGKVYPSNYILDKCTFVGIDAEGFEIYTCTKHGRRQELRVVRTTAHVDGSIPYGYRDTDELEAVESIPALKF